MHPFLSAIEYPAIDPVILRLGPLAVRWYGLAYMAGLALGYFGPRRMARTGRLRLSQDQIADLLCWLAAGVLGGGPLGGGCFTTARGSRADNQTRCAALTSEGSFHFR